MISSLWNVPGPVLMQIMRPEHLAGTAETLLGGRSARSAIDTGFSGARTSMTQL